MKITPLAFDSMGSRSMATYVETGDVKMVIDPGVALAPGRFDLPPHPLEIGRMNSQWSEIKKHAENSDILVVTHYHFDHHNPSEAGIYKDKLVMLKDPKKNINLSQTKRSKRFLENLEGLPKEIMYSDGREFSFEKTLLRFSEPVTHGMRDRLGYVTEVLVEDRAGKRFIHTSDVLGPCTQEQTDFILRENPDVLFADGPLNFTLAPAIRNLKKIVRKTGVKKLVIDHHLLRDLSWKEKIRGVFLEAEKKGAPEIMTAAEYAGKPTEQLEARRRELYAADRSRHQ